MIKLFKQRQEIDAQGRLIKPMKYVYKVASLQELFKGDFYKTWVESFPIEERFNMHYSVCACADGHADSRKFDWQDVVPFDFDGIDTARIDDYVKLFCNTTNLKLEDITTICSGNGLHILVWLDTLIDDVHSFETLRPYYKALCGTLEYYMAQEKLPGSLDRGVFSPGHTLRLPHTRNVKDDKQETFCRVLNEGFNRVSFNLKTLVQVEDVQEGDAVKGELFSANNVDTEGVLSCPFIQWCKGNQSQVREQQWYAMLSVIGRLPDAEKLAHEYSCEHPSYTEDETSYKLERSCASSGPRTCKNIMSMWDGCTECPHIGKIASPIVLKGPNYIKTQGTGYWTTKIDKNGLPVQVAPAYEDIIKAFTKGGEYITDVESRITYRYNGKHWEEIHEAEILSFVYDICNPKPMENQRKEFLKRLQCTNLRNRSFFETNGINLLNGWLNLDDMKLYPHTPAKGFMYVLPYAFDANATCPKFDKFLDEVTEGDKDTQAVLKEYAGYALSSCKPSQFEKALILFGDGSNGKSVFMDVLKEVAGKDNFSSVDLQGLKDQQIRYSLQGRLFNLAPETPIKSLEDSSAFKSIVSGEDIMVKRLYSQPFSAQITAKLIFSCNKMPPSNDTSHGMFRRMLIVPFKKKFTEANKDIDLRDKLMGEKAGILNSFIRAYLELRARKRFTYSVNIEKEAERYIRENDTVQNWMDEYCQIVPAEGDPAIKKNCESVDTLYEKYREYLIRNGEMVQSMTAFSRKLGTIHPAPTLRVTEHGRRKVCKMGIILIDGYANEQGDF